MTIKNVIEENSTKPANKNLRKKNKQHKLMINIFSVGEEAEAESG